MGANSCVKRGKRDIAGAVWEKWWRWFGARLSVVRRECIYRRVGSCFVLMMGFGGYVGGFIYLRDVDSRRIVILLDWAHYVSFHGG